MSPFGDGFLQPVPFPQATCQPKYRDGVIPPIVDISPTHILHPAWSPHARFHVMWQISVNSMLGLLTVLLIWWPGPNRAVRLKIGALLGCIALGGFVVAALTRHLYGGTFSETGGVPPVGGMDANVLAFTPAAWCDSPGV